MTLPAEEKEQLINTENVSSSQKEASKADRPTIGEKIALQDQALLEWSNLDYFIPSKPSKMTTKGNMIDAKDEKAFLAAEYSDELAFQNA